MEKCFSGFQNETSSFNANRYVITYVTSQFLFLDVLSVNLLVHIAHVAEYFRIPNTHIYGIPFDVVWH